MSGFLLDTNVVCETTKPQPDGRVLGWLGRQPAETVFISAITLGEVRHGALLLDEGRRKVALVKWIDGTMKPQFAGRILPADGEVMEALGGAPGGVRARRPAPPAGGQYPRRDGAHP